MKRIFLNYYNNVYYVNPANYNGRQGFHCFRSSMDRYFNARGRVTVFGTTNINQMYHPISDGKTEGFTNDT